MVSGTFSIPLGADGVDAELAGRKSLNHASRPALGVREFIAGEENHLVSVLLPALQKHDHTFAPLLLYGPIGCGKTMLALGLLERHKTLEPAGKTLFLTGADFARLYADALETASLIDFRRKFSQAALVVLDDVHTLAAKPAAQQEWRRLLDTLAQRGVRVIVTSRYSPGELVELDADLRSRLSGGLVVPLSWPGPDARREIIVRFLAARKTKMPAECVMRLATEVSGPPPRLFATLNQLLHTSQADHRPLDAALVAELLDEHAAATEVTARAIISSVAKRFQLKVGDLKGASRRQSVSTARGIAMLLLRQLREESYQEIGRHFERRDHTTVMHACEKTTERLAEDKQLAQAYKELKSQLTGA